ncbi:MAG: hypothetical protein LC127_14420 [Chitinophagales bacterium]|nr:hypothetical protein [Chitinophagales bacterium]
MENEIKLPTPPEGYEYIIQKKPTTKEEKVLQLEKEKNKLKKPDDKELLALGMMYHPYYLLETEINLLKNL